MFVKPLAVRLATFLFAAHLAAPSSAERLEDMWQDPRDFWNRISDDACDGDRDAYDTLVKGAEQEFNPVAMVDLTWLLTSSHCSFRTSDMALPIELTQRSAGMGYPIALTNYGEYLIEGHGVAKDVSLAKTQFYAAMEAGYGNAAAILGLYYTNDEFVQVDDDYARELHKLAESLGADEGKLKELASALASIDVKLVDQALVQAPATQSTTSEPVNGLFVNGWGIANDEAIFDFAPNGVLEAQAFVGVYEDEKEIYIGTMVNIPDPIVSIGAIVITQSDGSTTILDVGFCNDGTCFIDPIYNDNDDLTGSTLEVVLPESEEDRVMEALKSGSQVAFSFQTETSRANGQTYTSRLSLKGSRSALERLERRYGLGDGSVRPTATRITEGQYASAVDVLLQELNLTWVPKGDYPQAGKAIFREAGAACLFHTFVEHPNTGKTTREFDLSVLDATRIEWPNDILGGKTHYMEVMTIGSRDTTKIWTDYPDGTSDFKKDSSVSFYIGDHGNFDGIKPHLAKAIQYCNSVAGF